MNKKFRLCSKSLFLTYPKTNISVIEVKEQLEKILIKYKVSEYAIAKELHQDGTPHIHVWIKLIKKLDTTNQRLLDLTIEGSSYHGQYENAKKDKSSMEYVLKNINEEPTSEYVVSDNILVRLTEEGTIKCVESTMIDLAEKGQVYEALELYKKEKPKDYLNKHRGIRKNLIDMAIIKSGFVKPRFSLKDYFIEPALQNILDNYDKTKTLVLIGEAGTGKTQFLQTFLKESLGLTPLVINNIDGLRFFKNELHNAILFDDCGNWDQKSREEVIKLIDSEGPTTHNIKHGSVNIQVATPRILTLNPPAPYALRQEDKAIQRRMVVYYLNKSLIPPKGDLPILDSSTKDHLPSPSAS
jgi:hypothetical protein